MDIRGHLKQSIAGVEITSVPVLPDNYGTKSCVFIFTQERLQWVLNEHPEMFVDLVVVDEAHKIGDRARGILLEQVLQRISHDSTTRFIFSSPMSENPDALYRVLSAEGKRKEIVSEIVKLF